MGHYLKLCPVALAITPCIAWGQPVQADWVAQDGLWSEAANWSTDPFVPQNGIPLGTTYRAVLSQNGNPYTVELDDDRTVDEILVQGPTLHQTNGTLRVLGDIEVTGGFCLLGGDRLRDATLVESGGEIIFNGSIVLEDVAIDGGATLAGAETTLDGPLDVSGELRFHPQMSGILVLMQGQTFDDVQMRVGSGAILLGRAPSGATVVFGPDAVVETSFSSHLSSEQDQHWINEGLISCDDRASGAGLTILGGSFTNAGTIVAEGDGHLHVRTDAWENDGVASATSGGHLVLETTGVNSGTIEVDGGTCSLPGQWQSTGEMNITSGTLELGAQPGASHPPVLWRNEGVITGTDARVNLGGIFTSESLGDMQLAGSSAVHITGTLDNEGSEFTVRGEAPKWFLDRGTIRGGRITSDQGSRLFILDGGRLEDVTIAGDVGFIGTRPRFTFDEDITLESGSLSVYASAAEIRFESSRTVENFDFDVRTDPAAGGETSTLGLGGNTDLTLGASAAWRGSGGIRPARNTGASEQTFINDGKVIADDAPHVLRIDTPHFLNRGMVEATPGTHLRITPVNAWTNEGEISADNATLTLGAGPVPWRNEGVISARQSTVELDGVTSPAEMGELDFDDCDVQFSGTIDLAGETYTIPLDNNTYTARATRFRGGALSISPDAELDVYNRIELQDAVLRGIPAFNSGDRIVLYGDCQLPDMNLHEMGVHLRLGEDAALTTGLLETYSVSLEADATFARGELRVAKSIRESGASRRLTNEATLVLAAAVGGGRVLLTPKDFSNHGQLIVRNETRALHDPDQIDEPIVNHGSMRIGAGSVFETPRVALDEESTLVIELADDPQHDGTSGRLVATRDAHLGGALEVVFASGGPTRRVREYHILDLEWIDPSAPEFHSISLPELPPGLHWDVSQLYTSGRIIMRPEIRARISR